MRPSYLDRPVAEPTETPVLFAEGHEAAAHQGVIAERDAALARIAELEQYVVAEQKACSDALAAAADGIAEYKKHTVQVETELHEKTLALAEAESQIAELTKPKEPADEPSPKRGKKDQ